MYLCIIHLVTFFLSYTSNDIYPPVIVLLSLLPQFFLLYTSSYVFYICVIVHFDITNIYDNSTVNSDPLLPTIYHVFVLSPLLKSYYGDRVANYGCWVIL